MAGTQDPSENPVAINVVPMVDVIFCLCVFFMCSFKFKELQGRMDAWLPNKGQDRFDKSALPPPEVRVAILWDEANGRPVRKLGTRRVDEDTALQALIGESHRDWLTVHSTDVPVTIDADSRVPWQEVVTVMNLARREGVGKVEFAFGR